MEGVNRGEGRRSNGGGGGGAAILNGVGLTEMLTFEQRLEDEGGSAAAIQGKNVPDSGDSEEDCG